MPPNKKMTLYEVLGVQRNAKITEIGRAYNRIKAEMQKESTAPDRHLAAMAKVAYETLSDPARREEYDQTLGVLGRPVRKGRGGLIGISLVALLAVAGAGYYFLAGPGARPAERPAANALAPQEILEAVSPHLGRLQGALMSGEVRDLGTAVAVGENEMVTTCRGITAGVQLLMKVGEVTSKAELARANEDLDICTLTVKGAAAGIKVRQGVPAAREKIQAVVLTPTGPAQARQVSVARSIEDPKGAVVELKAAAPLPNGTPVFDSQARLVGIVTTPHAFGEGLVAALGAARIAQARAPAATTTAAASAAPVSTPSAPAAAAPPAEQSVAMPAPGTRRGAGGTLVGEGFTSLWKEDDEGRLIEVLDSPTKGDVGNPLAFWTLWSGRDSTTPQVIHCVVTFGPNKDIVADYDQDPVEHPADGYWYCALTRFQVELKDLPEGEYYFKILVEGKNVAESSIRIEKRFFTRGTYAVIVIVVGLGLLAFLRRNKVVGYSR